MQQATTAGATGGRNRATQNKALYRFAQLGGSAAASVLVEALASLQEGELRFIACRILDHQLPQGSAKVAADLGALLDSNERSMDHEKTLMDRPLREAMYRLRARAELAAEAAGGITTASP